METPCSKVIFLNYSRKNRLKIRSCHRYGEHAENFFVFQDYLFTLLYAAELALSR